MGREYRWQEFREDLFAPGASYCTGRIVDILSLKRRVPTVTLDCTYAFHQAPELEDVVVEPPEEYLNRLRASGMCTNIWWKLQKQLPGRRQAGQRWVDHFTSALVEKLGFTRCVPKTCPRRAFLQGKAHDWRIVESSRDHSVPTVCVGGLLYYMQDRADAQYEVSILGSMLGKPTQGSMIAREGVGKVEALEVRTLWLQQVVKAKTLTLKKVKSEDNSADLGTKILAGGTLSLLRNLNGLVDKNAMDSVPCGVRSITILLENLASRERQR